MRTAPQFSQKLPGKVAVLLRTAARFSQKHLFKNHPSILLKIVSENRFSGKTMLYNWSLIAEEGEDSRTATALLLNGGMHGNCHKIRRSTCTSCITFAQGLGLASVLSLDFRFCTYKLLSSVSCSTQGSSSTKISTKHV